MIDVLTLPGTTTENSAGPSRRPLGLLDLPPEVLNLVIGKLSPVTLSAFSRTSRTLHGYIQGLGDLVWRDLFLSIWDDPRLADEAIMAIRVPWFCISPLADVDLDQQPSFCSPSERPDEDEKSPTQFQWQGQVQRRISAEIFLSKFGPSSCVTGERIPARRFRTIRTLLSTITTTPSNSSTFTRSRNVKWLENLFRPSNFSTEFFLKHFLHDSDISQTDTEDRQLTAELQVHFLSTDTKLSSEQSKLSRLNARAYVYNIQNYREEGWHGPWRMTERGMEPNWIHLAACQRVVLENLAQRKIIGHNYPTPPTGAHAIWGGGSKPMATARENNPSRITENGFNDWAGVEGVWRRLVCFMDYRDFHEYNVHSRRPSGGLDTSVFKHKLFNEATRIITMTLKIIKSEPGVAPFEHRPKLHFDGFSVANDTMISAVHGFVHMTESGYVRWRLVTRYDTDDRWVTEAVQLGDAGSAAGFLGTWTGNHHEPDDPAGPTWLWKVADVSELRATERMPNESWVFPDVFFGGNVFGDIDTDDDVETGDEDEDEDEDDGQDEDEEMGDSDSDDGEMEDEDDESDADYDLPPPLEPIPSLYN